MFCCIKINWGNGQSQGRFKIKYYVLGFNLPQGKSNDVPILMENDPNYGLLVVVLRPPPTSSSLHLNTLY